MDSSVAIRVENVSKAYRIWENPSARLIFALRMAIARLVPESTRLGAAMRTRADRLYRNFYALKGVSFEVRRGQGMGIIGRNGSGKSTLLQIIAGTLQPTAGSVEVKGRVAALLELGSGFNPDFTGRENVYLNAAVLGLSRAQIDARFDSIAAFAEIGEFIDHSVLTYSSGMVLRLAFAVAVHVDPDILIIDEALSVGDARFQLKCARAIDRFIAQGVTLLFVSHETSLVKRLCQGAVLLEHGNMVYSGSPNNVVNLYSKLIADGGSLEALAPDIVKIKARDAATASADSSAANGRQTAARAVPAGKAGKLMADERQHVQITGQEFSYGGELGRIHEVAALDVEGQPSRLFTSGDPMIVRMMVEAYEDSMEPIFALTIKNAAGVEIYGTNTLFSKQTAAPIKARERREVSFSFDADLMPGHYFLSFGFTQFVGEEMVVIQRRYDALEIEIHGTDLTFGIANLKAVISTRPAD